MRVYQIKSRRLILKDRPIEGNPQEKLIKYGPDLLKVSELLAVVFNDQEEDVLELTERILKEYGSKAIIGQKNVNRLKKELKISEKRASQMVACFELGRRFFAEDKGLLPTIRTAQDVFKYLEDLKKLPKETLRGLYLNSRNKLIYDEVISIGSIESNLIHPREVFRPAIECGASAIILAHNHPSGDSTPSEDDIEITRQICKAGEIIGISLLDHIIICGDQFVSVPAEYNQ